MIFHFNSLYCQVVYVTLLLCTYLRYIKWKFDCIRVKIIVQKLLKNFLLLLTEFKLIYKFFLFLFKFTMKTKKLISIPFNLYEFPYTLYLRNFIIVVFPVQQTCSSLILELQPLKERLTMMNWRKFRNMTHDNIKYIKDSESS